MQPLFPASLLLLPMTIAHTTVYDGATDLASVNLAKTEYSPAITSGTMCTHTTKCLKASRRKKALQQQDARHDKRALIDSVADAVESLLGDEGDGTPTDTSDASEASPTTAASSSILATPSAVPIDPASGGYLPHAG